MIAEADLETELECRLNEDKIAFEQSRYKYLEKAETIDYAIFSAEALTNEPLNFETAVKYFLEKYVKTACTKRTYQTYESIFKINILPFFRGKVIQEITIDNIKTFYASCKTRNLGHRRLKNTLTQFNQLLKYCKSQGLVSKCCSFQVKRLNKKNEFSMNGIIFED